MSENTAAPQTVRQYRHAAVNVLKEARAVLNNGAIRTEESREVYLDLNGSIESILRGETGVTQEQQVERLTSARDKVEENLQTLPAKIEAAKVAGEVAIEKFRAAEKKRVEETIAQAKEALTKFDGIAEVAQGAVSVLTEAAQFAAERDFDAHQEAKRAARNRPYEDYEPEDSEY